MSLPTSPSITRRSLLQLAGSLAAALLPQAPATSSPLPGEIQLLECHIAGTSYADIDDLEPDLAPGLTLTLRREPTNPYDANAILVLSPSERKLGYIPRARNHVLARLMDAGFPLHANLREKAWHGDWLKVDIEVVMRRLPA